MFICMEREREMCAERMFSLAHNHHQVEDTPIKQRQWWPSGDMDGRSKGKRSPPDGFVTPLMGKLYRIPFGQNVGGGLNHPRMYTHWHRHTLISAPKEHPSSAMMMALSLSLYLLSLLQLTSTSLYPSPIVGLNMGPYVFDVSANRLLTLSLYAHVHMYIFI